MLELITTMTTVILTYETTVNNNKHSEQLYHSLQHIYL